MLSRLLTTGLVFVLIMLAAWLWDWRNGTKE